MKSYFTGEGTKVTQTEAAFIKNMCKELAATNASKLENISVVNSVVTIINSNQEHVLTKGADINNVKENIRFISDLYTLSAWLGEAIKAKEELDNELSNDATTDIGSYCTKYDIILPERTQKETIDFEDYISTMDQDLLAEYLYLEAKSAQYGKFIHPDGYISKMRKEALLIESNPIISSGQGRDTILTTRSLSSNIEEVNNLFFSLQGIQRDFQSAFNHLKAKIKNELKAINEDIIRSNLAINATYYEKLKKLNAERELEIFKRRNELSLLKITIPTCLQATLNNVRSSIK